MTDLTLARSWSPAPTVTRTTWLDALSHHAKVLRRRARRNRFLALTGQSQGRHYWIEGMFQSMSGR